MQFENKLYLLYTLDCLTIYQIILVIVAEYMRAVLGVGELVNFCRVFFPQQNSLLVFCFESSLFSKIFLSKTDNFFHSSCNNYGNRIDM